MISLRSLEIGDSDRIYELASNWTVAKSTLGIPHPYPKNDALLWIKDTLNNNRSGINYVQAITHNNTLIGVIGVLNIENSSGELGYWIGEDYWGKGYASAALKILIGDIRKNISLKNITSHCLNSNPASKKLLSSIPLILSSREKFINRENKVDELLKYEGQI